jgi:hypothetical protein
MNMDLVTPIGVQMEKLYNLWNVSIGHWPDESDCSHIELVPTGFNSTSEEQIELIAQICLIVQTGFWDTSIEALKELLPDEEIEDKRLDAIIAYFSGSDYINAQKKKDHIEKQRNPFILEVLSHVMLFSLEDTKHKPNLSLQAMHHMHLSTTIPGLDVAAIAHHRDEDQYCLVIGEAKNRKKPSDGTLEAFKAFSKHDSGETWAEVRQVMRIIADSSSLKYINTTKLSRSISNWSIWKEQIIYRLTIEHKSKKPQGGSQFLDFKDFTPNVKNPTWRQCEAFSIARLTVLYDTVSLKIVEFLNSQRGQKSA